MPGDASVVVPGKLDLFSNANGNCWSARPTTILVDSTQLDSSWLGRIIDDHFVDEISSVEIDPSGQNGEYHSFAFAGPMFREPVAWRPGDVRSDLRFSQLDVVED